MRTEMLQLLLPLLQTCGQVWFYELQVNEDLPLVGSDGWLSAKCRGCNFLRLFELWGGNEFYSLTALCGV